MQPIVVTSKVEIPNALVVFCLIVVQPAMSTKDQKILGRFLRLTLPRFSVVPTEDIFGFLIVCEDKIHNLVIVKNYRVG